MISIIVQIVERIMKRICSLRNHEHARIIRAIQFAHTHTHTLFYQALRFVTVELYYIPMQLCLPIGRRLAMWKKYWRLRLFRLAARMDSLEAGRSKPREEWHLLITTHWIFLAPQTILSLKPPWIIRSVTQKVSNSVL